MIAFWDGSVPRCLTCATHFEKRGNTGVVNRAKKKKKYELFFIRIISDTVFYNATYLNIFLFILFSIYKISFVSYIHTFIYYSFTRFFFLLSVNKRNKSATVHQVCFWIYIIMDKKESTGASFNKRKFVTICLNSSIINLLLFFFSIVRNESWFLLKFNYRHSGDRDYSLSSSPKKEGCGHLDRASLWVHVHCDFNKPYANYKWNCQRQARGPFFVVDGDN